MPPKPTHASGYPRDADQHLRRACLTIAVRLGDVLDELVVVGGLVPSLLPFPAHVAPETAHIGTMDLDLGLHVSLLDAERYTEIAPRLRAEGFEPDRNDKQNPTPRRWLSPGPPRVTIDFLIALGGAMAKRTLRVCGPGAFVVLKALALRGRGEAKDAYDLYFLLRHYGDTIEAVATRLAPLLDSPLAQRALDILREDFATLDHIGPQNVANFLERSDDLDFRQEVAGEVSALVEACEALRSSGSLPSSET